MKHTSMCSGSQLRRARGTCGSTRPPAAPVHHGIRGQARPYVRAAAASNGSRSFGKREEPAFPAFPVDETFPDEALGSNKYQDSVLEGNEALKSICAWETEGLPKHHTSR
jgi:hypothetical protein